MMAAVDKKRVVLTVEVDVTDEPVLREFANQRYLKAWGHDIPEGTGLETAVLEALVISNDNPSPDEYGIEIASYEAHELPS